MDSPLFLASLWLHSLAKEGKAKTFQDRVTAMRESNQAINLLYKLRGIK